MKNNDQTPRRGEICLGDLAKALSYFSAASESEREAVANCLGFQVNPSIAPTTSRKQFHPVQAAWSQSMLKQHRKVAAKSFDYARKKAMPPAPEPMPDNVGEVLPTQIEEPQYVPNYTGAVTPDSINEATVLPSPVPAVPKRTLFSKQTTRGIISSATMRPIPGRDLDVRRLIRASVKREYLKSLPVLPRLTNRNGCQLLLDFSEALMPWWEDMQLLIQQFHSVLGEAVCPVYEFDQSPKEAVCWSENEEIPWQTISDKPIVIATDLGVLHTSRCALRAGKTDWLEFVGRCNRRKIPVVVLFPLHPQRCPYGLDRLVTLVHWNPATSAAMIKRLVTQKETCR